MIENHAFLFFNHFVFFKYHNSDESLRYSLGKKRRISSEL